MSYSGSVDRQYRCLQQLHPLYPKLKEDPSFGIFKVLRLSRVQKESDDG
jgi:hypothetical protein